MNIAVTTSLYALAHELGPAEALAEFQRQLADPMDPNALPCTRLIKRLQGVGDLGVHVDVLGSNVAKMRSRAAHQAYATGADVWVSVDDDVESDFETLKALVEASTTGESPNVVIAPYLLRSRDVVSASFDADADSHARVLPTTGARCIPGHAGGFGLVAMSRATLGTILEANERLTYEDDDGVVRVGLFLEELSARKWWGEDVSFFRRLPVHVRVELLATGKTAHAGMLLDLSTLSQQTRMKLEGFHVHQAELVDEDTAPSLPPTPGPLLTDPPQDRVPPAE